MLQTRILKVQHLVWYSNHFQVPFCEATFEYGIKDNDWAVLAQESIEVKPKLVVINSCILGEQQKYAEMLLLGERMFDHVYIDVYKEVKKYIMRIAEEFPLYFIFYFYK